jgi:hypothetical protein
MPDLVCLPANAKEGMNMHLTQCRSVLEEMIVVIPLR